ncbi:unnamed protein product, partial [Polarella glacialis]
MQDSQLSPGLVAMNSVVNACAQAGDDDRAEFWLRRIQSQKLQPDMLSYNGVINACAKRGKAAAAEAWLEQMLTERLEVSAASYNSVINACAEGGEVELAESWLARLLASGLRVLKACARMGEADRAENWIEAMLRSGVAVSEELLRSVSPAEGPARTGSPLRRALYQFSSKGEAGLVEHLERALEYQWVYGYPRAPPGEKQLTHGTFKYISGMQPQTVREMLQCVAPEARSVLDPFCGSGAVLIEALAAGKTAIGCDAAPLALFVSFHHCDGAQANLPTLVVLAREVSDPLCGRSDDRQTLREAITQLPDSPERMALWFVFAVALNIASTPTSKGAFAAPGDPAGSHAKAYFVSAAMRYAARVRELRGTIPGVAAPVRLYSCDMRSLDLGQPVDAILTSPPYPGVYNYLPSNRSAGNRLQGSGPSESADLGSLCSGVVAGLTLTAQRLSDAEDSSADHEIGARRLMLHASRDEFQAVWQRQQEEWLRAAHSCLTPGGTATLMIGDGDTDVENGFDNLASTIAAAEAVGFKLVACSTIESVADEAHRTKGMQRTEHMVHLVAQ